MKKIRDKIKAAYWNTRAINMKEKELAKILEKKKNIEIISETKKKLEQEYRKIHHVIWRSKYVYRKEQAKVYA